MRQIEKEHVAKDLTLRNLIRFVFVGGFATGLHYSLILLFVVVLHWEMVTASAVGYIISAAVNFLLNAKLTFQTGTSLKRAAPRFALVSGAGLLLNSCILTFLLSFGIQAGIAQVITTIGVMIWNYVISGLWTFKRSRP